MEARAWPSGLRAGADAGLRRWLDSCAAGETTTPAHVLCDARELALGDGGGRHPLGTTYSQITRMSLVFGRYWGQSGARPPTSMEDRSRLGQPSTDGVTSGCKNDQPGACSTWDSTEFVSCIYVPLYPVLCGLPRSA